MLGRSRKAALLCEGHFNRLDAKTAIGVLRFRPEESVAVIDSQHAGRTAAACVGVGGDVPVVADLEGAAACGADTLLIGIAPQGGGLPASWRGSVRAALARGWDVISGMHAFLADDPDLASLADRHGGVIHDVRRPPTGLPVAAGRAADVEARVLLTVGTDCNVGKMTASLALLRELKSEGIRTAFVATGQTGIMLADEGVAVDAVPSDFAAGAVEAMVVRAARDADVVIVEGQGALHHPGYSGVTLSLMHGAAASEMVLCHWAGRTSIRRSAQAHDEVPIPPLSEVCEAYERAAAWVRPARVIGLALNTATLGEDAARSACRDTQGACGRPACDPVRFGAGPLVQDFLNAVKGVQRAPSA